MTKKIFRSTVAVGLAVLLASLVIIMGALYTYFGHVQEQQLRDELSIAAAAMESGDGEAYLSKLHSDNYRITWLRADGCRTVRSCACPPAASPWACCF